MFQISRLIKMHGNNITYYPYRQARIKNIIMVIKPEQKEYLKELKWICERTDVIYDYNTKNFIKTDEGHKAEPDNHIMFTIGEDLDEIAIMFTDGEIWIGTGDVEISNW